MTKLLNGFVVCDTIVHFHHLWLCGICWIQKYRDRSGHFREQIELKGAANEKLSDQIARLFTLTCAFLASSSRNCSSKMCHLQQPCMCKEFRYVLNCKMNTHLTMRIWTMNTITFATQNCIIIFGNLLLKIAAFILDALSLHHLLSHTVSSSLSFSFVCCCCCPANFLDGDNPKRFRFLFFSRCFFLHFVFCCLTCIKHTHTHTPHVS